MAKCLICHKFASFGFPEGKKEYCTKHKKDNMIDLINVSRCAECNKHAYYGFPGDSDKWCKTHKRPGMVNLSNNKRCLNCDNYAIYGLNKKLYCAKHRDSNMINLKKSTLALCGEV